MVFIHRMCEGSRLKRTKDINANGKVGGGEMWDKVMQSDLDDMVLDRLLNIRLKCTKLSCSHVFNLPKLN